MTKPPGKVTGRLKFVGKTQLGNIIVGPFWRFFKRSMQIKSGNKWRDVIELYPPRLPEASS